MKSISDPPNKSELLIGAFLLLVSGAFLFSSITPGHDWGGDFAAYLHQGKALASGSIEQLRMLVQYRIENSTNEWIIGPDFYPWGFPAFLALVFIAFGESLFAMKCLLAGFVLGCQVVTYLLLRGRTSIFGCYAVAFVFGMNSFVYFFKDSLLSDIPFTFFVILTLLLSRKFLLEKKDPSILNLVSIGITMSVAFCIRTHAIALLPTVAFLQLIGKTEIEKRRSVLALLGGLRRIRFPDFIPYLVFALSAAGVTMMLSDPIESYASTGHVQVGAGLLGRIFVTVKNGILYYGLLPKALFHVPNVIYALVIVPVLLLGVFRAGLRNIDLLIFAFFHISILLIFSGRQGLRFILPVLPIMIFFLFIGGREAARWFKGLRSRTELTKLTDIALATILVVGVSGPITVQAIQERSSRNYDHVEPGPYTPNSQDIFDYIRNNIEKEESIVFWKPRVLSYLTDRKSGFYFRIEDLTNGRHRYVLVYLGDYHPTDKGKFLVDATSRNFRLIYRNPDFALYEILTSVERSE